MPTKILNAAQDILAGAEVAETVSAYELDQDEETLLLSVLEVEGWSPT